MDIKASGFSNIDINKFLAFFTQMFLAQGSAKSVNAPLWFVPCLFAVEIMYFYISKKSLKTVIVICSLLSLFGWLLESNIIAFDNTVLPWSFDSALFPLGFFAFGNCFSDKIKVFLNCINLNKYKIAICIFL